MTRTHLVSLTGIALAAACSRDLVIDHGKEVDGGNGGVDAGAGGGATGGSKPGNAGTSGGTGAGGSPVETDAHGGAGGNVGGRDHDGGPGTGGTAPEGGTVPESGTPPGGEPPIDESCGAVVRLDSIDGTGPGTVVLDDANVYWTQGASLRRVSKSVRDGVTIATDNSEGIAVDGSYVYWSSYTGDTLGRSVKTGTPQPVILQQGFANPRDLTADGSDLYVVTTQGLARVGKDVGATPTIIAADATSSSAVVTDATSVYFVDNLLDLVKLDKTTQSRTRIASGVSGRFAVDGAAIYYSARSGHDQEIYRADAALGRLRSLGHASGESFALDAQAIYFYVTDAANVSSLVKVPKTSGGAMTLSRIVHNVGEPFGGHYIAADDTYVFFIDGGDLMRYKKCSSEPADGGAGSAPRVDGGCPGVLPNDPGASAPSCDGLATTCGPCGNENCCESPRVTGGTFYRTYEGPNLSDRRDPATVSDFRLDRFEITVGRFRRFVAAWDAGYRPLAGAGKHTHLNGGMGLTTTGFAGYETGWQQGWEEELPAATSGTGGWDERLSCDPGRAAWTSNPGALESEPVRCVDWYSAYAFCIWDGGFLPSEAEWAYAATGGTEQRVFPWSSPAASTEIDCAHANYVGASNGTEYCTLPGVGAPNRVGWNSPLGDGKYGQADLAGNVLEWTLDQFDRFPNPCTDCGMLAPASNGVLRGGGYDYFVADLHTTARVSAIYTTEIRGAGARCARAP